MSEMICPICHVGEILIEWDDPEGSPELICSNDNCPTSDWGIYCYMVDKVNDQKSADELLQSCIMLEGMTLTGRER